MASEASPDVVELRVGDEHPVRLEGLGTAGYRWSPHLEGDTEIAAVDRAGAEGSPGEAVGSSADELFMIHALRPGVTRVRFAQRRSWESADQPAASEHLVELHVVDD